MRYSAHIWKGRHLGIVTYKNEWIFLQTSLEDIKIDVNGCGMFLSDTEFLEKIKELVEWWSIKKRISNSC